MAVIQEISQQKTTFLVIYAKGHGILLVLFGRFGFYKYMKMDEEEDDRPFFFPNPDGNDHRSTSQIFTVVCK